MIRAAVVALPLLVRAPGELEDGPTPAWWGVPLPEASGWNPGFVARLLARTER